MVKYESADWKTSLSPLSPPLLAHLNLSLTREEELGEGGDEDDMSDQVEEKVKVRKEKKIPKSPEVKRRRISLLFLKHSLFVVPLLAEGR